MDKKNFITGTLLLWSLISTSWAKWDNFSHNENYQKKIYLNKNNLFNTINTKTTYSPKENEIKEILQENITGKVIKGTINYFDSKFTSIKLTQEEKNTLGKNLENYLKNNRVIYIKWNKVILEIDEKQFKDLFSILLPYFAKWNELKNQPKFIKENANVILKYMRNSKWKEANKYFYNYFWCLFMEIVKWLEPYDMTIYEFTESLQKWYKGNITAHETLNWKSTKNISIKDLGNVIHLKTYEK